MTEQNEQAPALPAEPPVAPPPPAYPPAPPGAMPVPVPAAGPVGKVRSTGMSILLFIVTFGIYGLFWWFFVHEEMKRHTGRGIGGLLALILAFLISPVAAFVTSDEVGKLYQYAGRPAPVSALTGLWYFPGSFLLVLPIVWFVKTNGALNEYWRSVGAA